MIRDRLQGTINNSGDAFASADEFLAELRALVELGQDGVEWLVAAVEQFGFHLAYPHARQHAKVYEASISAALAEAFPDSPSYSSLDERDRVELLMRLLGQQQAWRMLPSDNPEVERFRIMRECNQRSPGTANTIIIAGNRGASDFLAVLIHALRAGWSAADGLQIVPLSETVDDLQSFVQTIDTILDLRLEAFLGPLMVGYSDSGKLDGVIAARVAIYRCLVDLAAMFKRRGIRRPLYHGSGGSPGRAGEEIHLRISTEPRGVVDGCYINTIQGEARQPFRDADIAVRSLERISAAVLRATMPNGQVVELDQAWDALAHHTGTAYTQLVRSPRFTEFLRQFIPAEVLREFGRRISSRPMARIRTSLSVDNLRAIPWNFGWIITRLSVPVWYGLGTAWQVLDAETKEAIRRSYRQGQPFAVNLVNLIEKVLGTTVPGIAKMFGQMWVEDRELVDLFLTPILDELEKAKAAILDIRGSEAILDNNQRLRESIQVRNRYAAVLACLLAITVQKWRQLEVATVLDEKQHQKEIETEMNVAVTITQGIAQFVRCHG